MAALVSEDTTVENGSQGEARTTSGNGGASRE
jgi:hypothetical protein